MDRLRLTITGLFLLPILAAFAYSADDNVVFLFSLLLSALLFTVGVTYLTAKITHTALRVASAYVFCSLLAIYFFAQLVSYYFQGMLLNQQFFYHFTLTTLRITFPIYYPFVLLFLAWMALIWITVWNNKHQLKADRVPAIALIPVLLIAMFVDPSIRRASAITLDSLRNSSSLDLDLIDWEAQHLHRAALSQSEVIASPGKNLLIIYMEGLERAYTNSALFPDLTPNLSSSCR